MDVMEFFIHGLISIHHPGILPHDDMESFILGYHSIFQLWSYTVYCIPYTLYHAAMASFIHDLMLRTSY